MSIKNSDKTSHMKKHWYNTRLIQSVVFLCAAMFSDIALSSNTEYKIKAAYLYQFTKFTEWPNELFIEDATPIKICILGLNPFGKSLDSFSSRTSQQRDLSIKYLSSLKNISSCHVIFISRSEENRLTKILQRVENSPVLTVSDIEDFAHRGGIIGFVAKHKKVGIEININASRTSGARLSSKLLEVATLVHDRLKE